jgi:hypothetical protein
MQRRLFRGAFAYNAQGGEVSNRIFVPTKIRRLAYSGRTLTQM